MVEAVHYISPQGEFRVKCPNGTVAYFREEEINYWDEGEENKRIAVSSPPMKYRHHSGSQFQIACVHLRLSAKRVLGI